MINITTDQSDQAKFEAEVKAEIEAYNKWYVDTFNAQPLGKFEQLTIQTYLVARLSRRYPG